MQQQLIISALQTISLMLRQLLFLLCPLCLCCFHQLNGVESSFEISGCCLRSRIRAEIFDHPVKAASDLIPEQVDQVRALGLHQKLDSLP